MTCLVDGCMHKQSKANRGKTFTGSWDEYQICPCCHYEIFGDTIYYDPKINKMCSRAIKLELLPKKESKPDLEWIEKIKNKKKRIMVKMY